MKYSTKACGVKTGTMEFDIVHRAGKIKWKNSIWSDALEKWKRNEEEKEGIRERSDTELGQPIHRFDSRANMKGHDLWRTRDVWRPSTRLELSVSNSKTDGARNKETVTLILKFLI